MRIDDLKNNILFDKFIDDKYLNMLDLNINENSYTTIQEKCILITISSENHPDDAMSSICIVGSPYNEDFVFISHYTKEAPMSRVYQQGFGAFFDTKEGIKVQLNYMLKGLVEKLGLNLKSKQKTVEEISIFDSI